MSAILAFIALSHEHQGSFVSSHVLKQLTPVMYSTQFLARGVTGHDI